MVLRTSSEDKFVHDPSDLGTILWLAHADDRACGRVQAYRTAGTGQSPGECAGPAEGASFFLSIETGAAHTLLLLGWSGPPAGSLRAHPVPARYVLLL